MFLKAGVCVPDSCFLFLLKSDNIPELSHHSDEYVFNLTIYLYKCVHLQYNQIQIPVDQLIHDTDFSRNRILHDGGILC